MERIQVSENRRFLVTESGKPFFWLGDTAWELFHRLSREEAYHYLENRRERGLNVIQAVALAEMDGLRAPNFYGETPLIDLDPSRPNEAYFTHVDTIVRMAAEKGLYIALLPTWGDKVIRMWGSGPEIFNPQNARAYGEYLGKRYKNDINVLWMLGGEPSRRGIGGVVDGDGGGNRGWGGAAAIHHLSSQWRARLIGVVSWLRVAGHEHLAVGARGGGFARLGK